VSETIESLDLRALIAQQREGYSLAQPFYQSPAIFEFERAGWLRRQWFILAHGSEVGRSAYIIRELLGESIILARDDAGTVRGFFNVCRHRGSRICDADGRGNALVCPYHAWSYRFDGSLRSAAALPDGVDRAGLGLKSISLTEVGGLILGSLQGAPQDSARLDSILAAGLRYHGIDAARVAARRSYPTKGNWKLVAENFVECYHCMVAHPEYSSVMSHVEVLARPASEAAKAAFQQSVDQWWEKDADQGSPVARIPDNYRISSCAALRGPIGGGRLTQSEDGRPVAALMGNQTRFDGGFALFRCEPFVYLAALNDHAVMFQFTPQSAERTDVTVSWLVADTVADSDLDLSRLTWLWDVTTVEDKALVERNAKGVASIAYEPGPYTELEALPARFVSRYLEEMKADLDGRKGPPASGN
jgi:Rieske 2Fe-2S family protein